MKPHRFDPISFTFGAVFSAIALVFLVSAQPWDLLFDGIELRWVFPLLVLVGGAMLLMSVLKQDSTVAVNTSRDRTEPSEEEIAAAEEELSEPPSV